MEDIGRGDAAGQRPIDRDVLGVDHVPDIDHRGHRHAAFIDPAIDRDVRKKLRPLLEPLDLAQVGEQFLAPVKQYLDDDSVSEVFGGENQLF